MYALHVIALTSCVVVLYSFPVLLYKTKKNRTDPELYRLKVYSTLNSKGILFYKRLFVGQHSSQDSLFTLFQNLSHCKRDVKRKLIRRISIFHSEF